jgi:hypothetical protein
VRRSFVHSMAEISCEQREAIEVKHTCSKRTLKYVSACLKASSAQASSKVGYRKNRVRTLNGGDGVCSIINNKWRTRRLTSLT